MLNTTLRVLPLLLLIGVRSAGASGWYVQNLPPGRDIQMMDLRWAHWPPGTYFAFWNGGFTPADKDLPKAGNYYGGLVAASPAADSPKARDYHPNLIWSFWWGEAYGGDVVENTYVHPTMSPRGRGGEGVCAGMNGGGNVAWMRAGDWYRMVMRVWQPSDDSPDSRVGWWAKDVSRNTWRHLASFRIPCKIEALSGNCGFVERLGGGPTARSVLERRLGYSRVDGRWVASNSMSVKAGPGHFWHASLIENDTVARFLLSGDAEAPANVPMGERKALATRQPDRPPLDAPAVTNAVAKGWERQVALSWEIPAAAAPQLAYRIEAFALAGAQGKALGAVEARMPHIRTARLDTAGAAQSVRLTVTDIFDQTVVTVLPVGDARPVKAVVADGLRNGLTYAYYEPAEDEEWTRLPDFAARTPLRRGIVKDIDLSVRGDRPDHCALRYSGFLRAPATGLYVFELASHDGSRLAIDGQVIADDDGRHGPSPARYSAALSRGLHALELVYFAGQAPHGGKYTALRLGWEGPGFAFRPIESADLACTSGPRTPTVRLLMPADGAQPADNLVNIPVRVDAQGQDINVIEYFRGDQRLQDETGDNDVLTALLPAGENRLWARLWYGDARSVDSEVLTLHARNRTAEPWDCSILGEQDLPLGVRHVEDTFAFVGDGVCFANRPIEGDFTLTARVADLSAHTPDGGIDANSWIGLLLKKTNTGKPFSWYYGIYRTAGCGVRGSPDFRDLGARRKSDRPVGGDDRWLRLVRRGTTLRTFTSLDGRQWRQATEQIERRLPKRMYAGPVFRMIPGLNRELFRASLDNVSLSTGADRGPAREPIAADLLPAETGRAISVVQADADPKRLYARTYGAGLLRSTDGGESWQPANGAEASPEFMAVRTFAVHPTNGLALLRGGGAVVGGKLVSGLWKSGDGGDTWRQVGCDIDFAGRGPTALFGETLAFDPHESDRAAAAGETAGVFLSRDGGETWEHIGLSGRRTTCLAFSLRKPGMLGIGTFADKEFETLGLGRPLTPAPTAVEGGLWYFWCDGKTCRAAARPHAPDLGVVNIVFRDRINLALLGATRGLYATWAGGGTLYQRRHTFCKDELLIAVDGSHDNPEAVYAAPFASGLEGPICVVGKTGRGWRRLNRNPEIESDGKNPRINAGITCVLQDKSDKHTLFLCNRDGIWKSTDRGRSYRRVYSNDANTTQATSTFEMLP